MKFHLFLRFSRLLLSAVGCLALFGFPESVLAECVPLAVVPAGVSPEPDRPVPSPLVLRFPGEAAATLRAEKDAWGKSGRLTLALVLPADAPSDVQTLVHVLDWDGLWYQKLLADPLLPGTTNTLSVDVSPYAEGWTPKGHHGVWNRRSLMEPEEVGFRLFSSGAYTGTCEVVSAEIVLDAPENGGERSAPRVSRVRALENIVPVDGLYELLFDLSDRYTNPFDSREIAVDATVTTPSGAEESVPCFYYQDYYRRLDETGEIIEPQGRPGWRLRYSPAEPGEHTVALTAADAAGTSRWERIAFTAVPAPENGLHPVHVAKGCTNMFEKSDGTPFYPIGFNIRSPFDTRMDKRYPDRFRHPEGTLIYDRYFRNMEASGLSFAEIWSSSWCMGLEWTPRSHTGAPGTEEEWTKNRPGYHGMGQYNLIHAWERDQVFFSAARHGIYLNLVLNNHGRLSVFSDPEWRDNPYNTANGGFLEDPIDWFSDERSCRMYEDQLRYEIARYGAFANLFAWEFWSELDLSGGVRGMNPRAHFDGRVVGWHRRMSEFLDRHDLRHHLISTHFSGNYRNNSPPLCSMPGITHCCFDAYHGGWNSLQLFELLTGSGEQSVVFGKPVLVTEFGGSWAGSDLVSLKSQLQVGLWASPAVGLAGSPMFWWWHIVEEADFFPVYAAFSRFMKGVDPRLPGRKVTSLVLPKPESCTNDVGRVVGSLNLSAAGGFGWFGAEGDKFMLVDAAGPKVHTGYTLDLETPVERGILRAEFWDTELGQPVEKIDFRVKKGKTELRIPPFARDIALKFLVLPYEDGDAAEETGTP